MVAGIRWQVYLPLGLKVVKVPFYHSSELLKFMVKHKISLVKILLYKNKCSGKAIFSQLDANH